MRLFLAVVLLLSHHGYSKSDEVAKAYRLIQECPQPSSPLADGGTVSLVLTVNGLVDIGKDATIAALKKYLDENRDFTTDAQRVRLIVAMMFDVPHSGAEMPHPAWYNPTTRRWRGFGDAFEYIIVDGIPFNVVGDYSLSGRFRPLDELITWADEHGIFRRDKLVVSSDPQRAARTLMKNLKATDYVSIRPAFSPDEDRHIAWLEKHLRAQAQIVADARRARKGEKVR